MVMDRFGFGLHGIVNRLGPVLDDRDIVLKAGDVLIQRGTNHAWSNRSDKRVRILYILIDGRFDPELEVQF